MQVNWREWGKEAFEDARRREKPLLLSISATWCHWCHVMDEKTYSDPQVVERINRDFIPVRVDADRRPDIDRRYNMGGWPTTAFLAPDGSLIAGATYLPPAEMLRAMEAVLAGPGAGAGGSAGPLRRLRSIPGRPMRSWPRSSWPMTPPTAALGDRPNSPSPTSCASSWRSMCEAHWMSFGSPLLKTLREMAGGGMYDQVEGDFSATPQPGTGPSPITKKCWKTMLCFWESTWMPTWRRPRIGSWRLPRTYVGFCSVPCGMKVKESFTGARRPTRNTTSSMGERGRSLGRPQWTGPSTSTGTPSPAGASSARPMSWMSLPWLRRQSGPSPFSLPRAPGRTAPRTITTPMDPTCPVFSKTKRPLAGALMEAFQYTGREDYLQLAEGLIAWACRELWDDEAGCFRDTQESLLEPVWPFMENAGAALALLKLAALTGKEDYRKRAGRILESLLPRWKDYGYMAGELASALRLYTEGSITVAVAGPEMAELARIARREYLPGKVVFPGQRSDEDIALICVGELCLAPAKTKEELSQLLCRIRKEPLRM